MQNPMPPHARSQDEEAPGANDQPDISPEQRALLEEEASRLAEAQAEQGAAAQPQAGEGGAQAEGAVAELAQLKEQLIRTVAELENVRKRSEREVQDARKYAVTGFARDLVQVGENLQLALKSISPEARQADEKLENLAQGVEMTYNELLRIFQGHGIVRIDPLGEKFNHNHHQAVAQVEDPAAEPGTVVQVLQAGYIIHDRLLRPAMVTVAKGGDPQGAVDTQA